jgi:hypothetical protein
MATKQMFAHFNGTRSGFEAKVGNKSNYDNCIVFISGGGTEEPCIYTHGKYYADDTFLKNLDASVKELNYVKGITVGGKTYDFYSVENGGSYLPFADTSTAKIDASNDGTLQVSVIGLGTKDTTDSSTSDYAWGRIKYLQSQLDNIDGSIGTQIGDFYDTSVAPLVTWKNELAKDASVKDTSNGISVKVTTNGGEVTAVSVGAPKFALDSSIEEFYKDGKILAGALPDYILGQVMYGGTIGKNGALSLTQDFNSKFTTKPSTLPSDASTYEGVYFIATAAGTSQNVTYAVGDWVISSGVKWEKIDNTDAVSSVAGLTGAITVPQLIEKLDSSIDGIISGWWGDTSVDDAKLGIDSVTTTKIKNDSVTEAKLDASVRAKLNADKVTSISSSSDYLTYNTSTGAVTTSLTVGSYEGDTEGIATVDDIKYALSWVEL